MACIIWTAGQTSTGYGQQRYEGTTHKAHRVAWARANGKSMKDIKGLVIRHTCDTPLCVNPEHLLPGDRKSNYADARERGRNTRGSIHGSAKLTQAQVQAIRDAVAGGETQTSVGKRYSVGQDVVSRIVNNKAWKDLV